MPSVAGITAGYGPTFPPLEDFFKIEPDQPKMLRLSGASPFEGRYYEDVAFLENITSQRVLALLRFKIIAGKLLALNDALTAYNGKHSDKKVVHSLTQKDKEHLKFLASTPGDIVRAECIERFTEHDTAAAGDYFKILMGHRYPDLEPMIEGVVFGDTSEDTMSLVFGAIANHLVLGHFLPRLIKFLQLFLSYVEHVEEEGPIVMPGLTHEQAAEPTTWGKRVVTDIKAIAHHLVRMRDEGRFIPFSGKWNGAIGNSSSHCAAYSDLDWSFRKQYVEQELGLTYDEYTFQSSTYAIEAGHFTALANMATHLLKLLYDFKALCSCPGQQFIKLKTKGTKGSSIMPNKTNLWAVEGAIEMLIEFIDDMKRLAERLPVYPHEGNMGRSYLFRALGRYFQPAFVALARVEKEVIGNMKDKGCVPNRTNLAAIIDTYPGMAGSSIQTVLKREGIEGDAYRQIEAIAIKPDGTYANAEEFREGLDKVIAANKLSEDIAEELRQLLDPECNYGSANQLASAGRHELEEQFWCYLNELEKYQRPLL